jgi:hypothetical protein
MTLWEEYLMELSRLGVGTLVSGNGRRTLAFGWQQVGQFILEFLCCVGESLLALTCDAEPGLRGTLIKKDRWRRWAGGLVELTLD